MQKQYDIIIVGAGMVGLMLAHLLKETGLNIAILEAKDHYPAWPRDGYDSRVSALNKHSQNLLHQIDCWHAICAMRTGPYDKMQVWEPEGDYQLIFDAADEGKDYLGHIVENSVIRKALLDNLPNHIALYCPVILTAINEQGVTLNNNETLQAKLIVAADGANSWVRSNAGFELTTYSYQQQALVATVKTEKPHNLTAYQNFLPTGPLAFLPLDDAHTSSIVWSADEQVAQQLLAQSQAEFEAALTNAFEHKLGNVSLQSERFSYPLHMRHAIDYVKPGIALVGDALRTIHPLAGQGVNLGFKDAQVLAETILNSVEAQRDFASLRYLKKYQRARKPQTLAAIVAMEFFKQAFSVEHNSLKAKRKSVIELIQKNQWTKNLLSKVASGN